MKDIVIASMMLCKQPRKFNNRLILSGYDGVWDAIEELPVDLKPYFTDDIGNSDVYYGGFLQLVDPKVLDVLSDKKLFACFRGINRRYLEHVQAYPQVEVYQNLIANLKLMGWDISTGNGWRSASSDGYYPINPFTGKAEDENISQLNEYGLFSSLENCLEYCELNNKKRADDSPWYPVAIYVDQDSYKRLIALINQHMSQ